MLSGRLARPFLRLLIWGSVPGSRNLPESYQKTLSRPVGTDDPGRDCRLIDRVTTDQTSIKNQLTQLPQAMNTKGKFTLPAMALHRLWPPKMSAEYCDNTKKDTT
jgi:hypothetical protein